MKKILFVCWGNICRSPSAEMIMKQIVKDEGLDSEFYIESAGTSAEEEGNGIYPHSKQKLIEKGISVDNNKRARKLTKEDNDSFDYIVVTDSQNYRRSINILGTDTKVSMLMAYTDTPKDIDDPWSSRNFELAYNDIYKGCLGLFEALKH